MALPPFVPTVTAAPAASPVMAKKKQPALLFGLGSSQAPLSPGRAMAPSSTPNVPSAPNYKPPEGLLDSFGADVKAQIPSVRAANGMDPVTGAPIAGWKRPAPAPLVAPGDNPLPPAPPTMAGPSMSAPQGLGASFAKSLTPPPPPPAALPSGPARPLPPLLPPVPAVASRPPIGRGMNGAPSLSETAFGSGLGGTGKPLVPYQGGLGNGGPSGAPAAGQSEADFVAGDTADGTTDRRPKRLRTGKYRGLLPAEAQAKSREKYAAMNPG